LGDRRHLGDDNPLLRWNEEELCVYYRALRELGMCNISDEEVVGMFKAKRNSYDEVIQEFRKERVQRFRVKADE
jgi:hypothetical protein